MLLIKVFNIKLIFIQK